MLFHVKVIWKFWFWYPHSSLYHDTVESSDLTPKPKLKRICCLALCKKRFAFISAQWQQFCCGLTCCTLVPGSRLQGCALVPGGTSRSSERYVAWISEYTWTMKRSGVCKFYTRWHKEDDKCWLWSRGALHLSWNLTATGSISEPLEA